MDIYYDKLSPAIRSLSKMTNQGINSRIFDLKRIVKRLKAYKEIDESYKYPIKNPDRDMEIEELENAIKGYEDHLTRQASE